MAEGPVLAEPAVLKGLQSPTLIDLRSAEEIAERPSAPGSINLVWSKPEAKFETPEGLPQDKVSERPPTLSPFSELDRRNTSPQGGKI